MEKLDFRKRLIEVRKAKGLTQGEVAEKCKVTTRTIQRIESGIVKPRAFTIKTISETLGFDFFDTSDTGYGIKNENQNSKLKNHTFLWHFKDLFNLKTNAMKKISILSMSIFLVAFLCINLLNTKAQSTKDEQQKSLIIQLNEDKSIQKVEASFTRNMNLDSLVQIRQDLQAIGITIHYKKIEFDVHNLLVSLDCQVICNDGFSGSFGTGDLRTQKKNRRFGFYRDYAPNSRCPFGTGLLDSK